jgi:thymidylate kinase
VVVLYDRYYFDFINDGKRSNINLPEKWVKPWYKLLLKPDVNFFLYADPQEILRRKQELNEEDIKSLTSKYLNLFKSLNKGKRSRYIPVENKNLDDTLNLIEKRTALSM